MIDAKDQPDEFLAHVVKATDSLMLIRVYRDRGGKLRAHYATGQYSLAEIDPMEVVELAHAATGCKPGRRIPEPKNSEGRSA
ncbi:hypothetical protein [Tsukamurella hominis]|uniref:hypothetical protein n=1 Tax=Tsukamurella hominis TaxID=1970232 RepID=UPI0039E93EB1